MRVCIIYTGHLRTWEKCKANHYANLGINDHDLWWHTYENPGPMLRARVDCMSWWTPIPCEYHYIIDHPYNAHRRPEISIGNTLNQWHNNFIGFCIVPADYDVYVRCRPDILLSGPVSLSIGDGNTVFIPSGNDYYNGINDQFAYGSYKAMKAYYSVYLNHAALFASGLIFHTEEYVTENIKRQGVRIERIPVTNEILRA